MKITSIDVYDFGKCLNYEDCSPICIRINTDAGISGFGEVGLAYGNAHNAGVWMVKDFGQLIIGKDPLRSEAIREQLFRTTFWGMGGGTVINAGMSAIDIALWDIKGKYYNAPVYQLLGGKINEKLRAYASQIQFDWDLEDRNMVTPEQYAEAAKKAMAQGYTAVKVDPVGVAANGNWQRTKQDADWRLRGQLPQNVLKLVRARLQAIRDLSPDLDIIIELHSFTDTSTAIQLANYIATLVGNGEHYAAHLLKNVKTYNNSAVVYAYDKDPVNVVEMQDSTVEAIKTGMHDLTTGSLSTYFSKCVVSAGAKTGTAETGVTDANNGTFVCFAPYDDPQIAVAVVIEKGGSGAALASTAVDIVNSYFSQEEIGAVVIGENTLLK